MWARASYYYIKPFIPRWLQIALRRQLLLNKLNKCRDIWPIDEGAAQLPKGWQGWPNNKKFALVLTHDVDTAKGHNNCRKLIDIEKKLGFRSSFNFVPERYHVSSELRDSITSNGFEVGVHGLNHDGKLYNSIDIFKKRAIRIKHYLKQWGAVGFRSPAMHHNLEWIHDLNIEYDASTFDTDPFEPQSDGVRTIFPFWVSMDSSQKRYIELPYTLPQDFTLFVLMGQTGIDIWKKKLDWLVKNGGMALLNVHPDYICFNKKKAMVEEYPVKYYEQFLLYLKSKYADLYWLALPKEMARFWQKNIPT